MDGKVQNLLIPDPVQFAPGLLNDPHSRSRSGRAVVDYMFEGVDQRTNRLLSPQDMIAEFDDWNIGVGQLDVDLERVDELCPLLAPVAHRVSVCVKLNPHAGVRHLRLLERAARDYPMVRAVGIYPLMTMPPIPPNSKECYPVYAKCAELDIPVFVSVGIPGPRVPGETQHPMALDDLCWFFPEVNFVMFHGGEPWVDLCVKLLLKWPNLFYMTSGFAPKYYPTKIVDFVNTRGTEKVLFGGYWPTLPYERLMRELAAIPLRDHVWRPFLQQNLRRLLALD